MGRRERVVLVVAALVVGGVIGWLVNWAGDRVWGSESVDPVVIVGSDAGEVVTKAEPSPEPSPERSIKDREASELVELCESVEREDVLRDMGLAETCEAVWEGSKPERVEVHPPRAVPTVHPAVVGQVADEMEAAVEFYGQAWPWVAEAWDRTSVVVVPGSLIESCPGARACVRPGGSEAVMMMPLATMGRDDWEETFLHELAHVWDHGRGGRWAELRGRWADYYAGCSTGGLSGEALVREVVAEAMAEVVGTGVGDGMFTADFGAIMREMGGNFDGCLVGWDWPAELETAMAAELIDCGADLRSIIQESRSENTEDSTDLSDFTWTPPTANQQRVTAWLQVQAEVC